MFTRRGFLIASGGTIGAMALAGAASAKAMQSGEVLTIVSATRAQTLAEQGQRHITLSGNRMKDLATLENVFAKASDAEITLHIDTADRVLLDVALTRVETSYQPVADAHGTFSFRRSSVFGV